MLPTQDGGLIVGGDSQILKLDSTGSVEWEKAYSVDSDIGLAGIGMIQETKDENYIITSSARRAIFKLDRNGRV